MPTSHATLLERYQRAQAQVTDLVDAVQDGQWDAPSLPGWTVADLVAHLVTGQRRQLALLAGHPAAEVPRDDPTGEVLGDDPLSAWEDAADAALTAWADPDALGHLVEPGPGPLSGAELLERVTAALTVHAWDLAHALGVDEHLDEELVTAALEVLDHTLPPDGVPGSYDAPLPVAGTAPALDRLVARTGRRP